MSTDVNLNRHRRNILLIFGGTILAVLLLLVFGLRAGVKKRSDMLADLTRAEEMLRPYQEGGASESLGEELAELQRENRQLQRRWDFLRKQVETFKEGSPLGGNLPSTEEGWIKFKVQLIEARSQLMARAAELGIELPRDLGIEEASLEAEDPEERLWQLASLVKLLYQCMESGIQSVQMAQTLPPLPVFAEGEPVPVLVEYPVLIRMTGTLDAALSFLESLQGEGRFFALRRFQIEKVGREPDSPLSILAVCGAEPFSGTNVLRASSVEGTENSEAEEPRPRGRRRSGE